MAASDEPKSMVEAALTNSSQMVPLETPLQVATASAPYAMPKDTKNVVSSIEIPDECWTGEVCIDRYLWTL